MVDNAAPAPANSGRAPPWLRHAGVVVFRHAVSAVLIVGVMWTVARPHAQEFIKDTVNDRLNLLEMQMNDVRQSSRDMQREQAIMSTDIGHVKDAQKDQRRDTRMILQSLQGLRRDLQAE